MKKYYRRKVGGTGVLEVVGKHESGDYLCRWLFGTDRPFRYHHYEFENEFIEVPESEVNSIERQRCARRNESPMGMDKEPLPDYWRIENNELRTCSFCGGLHPDDLLTLIEKYGFGIIEKTDKNYKWYISFSGETMKYYRQHDTKEFIGKYNEKIDEIKNH